MGKHIVFLMFGLSIFGCAKDEERARPVYEFSWTAELVQSAGTFMTKAKRAGLGIPTGTITLVNNAEASGCKGPHDLWLYDALFNSLGPYQQEQYLWSSIMGCFDYGSPISNRTECGGPASYMNSAILDESYLEANYRWLRDELFSLAYVNPNCP